MKKYYTFFYLILFVGMATAQPTITYSALPVSGTVKTTNTDTFGTNLWVDSSGINKTWDYSSDFIVHTQSTDTFKLASLATHTAIFPNSTLYTPAGGNWESFYWTDTTGYYYDGMSTGTLMTLDSDPDELIMPVPFSYTSSVKDTSYTKLEVGFGNYVSTYQIKTFEADAYGQLTTPYGTFNDVLRLKVSFEGKDSSVAGFPVNSTTVSDSTWTDYIWVQNENNLFLMSVSLDQNGNVTGGEYYSGSLITSNEKETEELIELTVFPNPANNVINWRLNTNQGIIKVFDLKGKEADRVLVIDRKPKMDISSFGSGLYLYVFYDVNGKKTATGEFIKN